MNKIDFWSLCGTLVDEATLLADLSSKAKEITLAVRESASKMSSGLLSLAISPGIHYDCPTPQSVPVQEILSCVQLGGMVLANLAARKAPAKWVRIVGLDSEKDIAVIHDPFWSSVEKPLKGMRKNCWEVVVISREGA